METIRVGIVGLGQNCRVRHVPGLRACEGVEIIAVCNRTPESTARAAEEYGIPRRYSRWEELVDDPEIDAVVVGTWPYLHAPVTIAALERGKHVLCEARMARNLAEAMQMVEAAQRHKGLVLQIVPSPFGLEVDRAVRDLLEKGAIGELREVVVTATNAWWADPAEPISWRQIRQLSGLNMVALGIIHETLIRWLPDPAEVYAHAAAFIPQRLDPTSGRIVPVELPDTVHVLARFGTGALAIYRSSAVVHGPAQAEIVLSGSEGSLKCVLGQSERIYLARQGETSYEEISVPEDQRGQWNVEADFIAAIRGQGKVRYTDPITGLRYMAFTDAVAQSIEARAPVPVPPLAELLRRIEGASNVKGGGRA